MQTVFKTWQKHIEHLWVASWWKRVLFVYKVVLNWYSHQHRLWPYLIHWMFWLDCPKGNEQSNTSDVDGNNAGRITWASCFIFSSGVGRGSALLQLVCLSSVEWDIVYWVFRPWASNMTSVSSSLWGWDCKQSTFRLSSQSLYTDTHIRNFRV